MTAIDDKISNVNTLLDKFDDGVRQYLSWIDCFKQIDSKSFAKVESKSEIEKWRVAFSESSKKCGLDISYPKGNNFKLPVLF